MLTALTFLLLAPVAMASDAKPGWVNVAVKDGCNEVYISGQAPSGDYMFVLSGIMQDQQMIHGLSFAREPVTVFYSVPHGITGGVGTPKILNIYRLVIIEGDNTASLDCIDGELTWSTVADVETVIGDFGTYVVQVAEDGKPEARAYMGVDSGSGQQVILELYGPNGYAAGYPRFGTWEDFLALH